MARWIEHPLNQTLLSLIVAIQDHAKATISKSILFEDIGQPKLDWRKSTQEFYNSLPDQLLASNFLTKCDANFDDIIRFNLTDEMKSCPHADLGRFIFTFWSNIAD